MTRMSAERLAEVREIAADFAGMGAEYTAAAISDLLAELDAVRAERDALTAERNDALRAMAVRTGERDEAWAEVATMRTHLAKVLTSAPPDGEVVVPFAFIDALDATSTDRAAYQRIANHVISGAARVLMSAMAAQPEDRRNFVTATIMDRDATYSLILQRDGAKSVADLVSERDALHEALRLLTAEVEASRHCDESYLPDNDKALDDAHYGVRVARAMWAIAWDACNAFRANGIDFYLAPIALALRAATIDERAEDARARLRAAHVCTCAQPTEAYGALAGLCDACVARNAAGAP